MKRALGAAVIGWLLAITMVLAAAKVGVRLNISPSVPLGVYWLSTSTPVRGGYVAVCPPPSPLFKEARARGYLSPGSCPFDFGPMIKVFAAGQGDHVRIDADGVRINDRLWPRSLPLPVDASGWVLPQSTGLDTALSKDAVLVMSEQCGLGFDSRYFGPLQSSAITASAVPLFTW
jgi:conjugative transfer signal peptidase TraF